jgi:hypothetical protein
VRALRNRVRHRVKENIAEIKAALPFPLPEVDSGNGGVGNKIAASSTTSLQAGTPKTALSSPAADLTAKTTTASRNRGDIVHKSVGYHRYDTDAEHAALAGVYRYLCPLCSYISAPGSVPWRITGSAMSNSLGFLRKDN